MLARLAIKQEPNTPVMLDEGLLVVTELGIDKSYEVI
jgi:hypothetical protein